MPFMNSVPNLGRQSSKPTPGLRRCSNNKARALSNLVALQVSNLRRPPIHSITIRIFPDAIVRTSFDSKLETQQQKYKGKRKYFGLFFADTSRAGTSQVAGLRIIERSSNIKWGLTDR